MRNTQDIPKLPKVAVAARGPRLYGAGHKAHTGGPGVPPPGFVTAKTSEPEWKIYWALGRVFGAPSAAHIRDYPFSGAPGIWSYQAFADTGGLKDTNIDFVVWPPSAFGTPTAIRVLGGFSHDPSNSKQTAHDLLQRGNLEHHYDVVDIPTGLFDWDGSGQAAVVTVKSALLMIEPPNVKYLLLQRRRGGA